MSRFFTFGVSAIAILFSVSLDARSSWLVHDNLVLPDGKQSDYGIGVVFVELNQHNVSAVIQRIDEDSVEESINDKQALDLEGRPWRLDLTGRTGLVTVNLPEGLYQIIQVDVPHFDLPFRVSTDNSDIWRFRIQAGHISYLGQLEVGAVRAKENVDVVWLNRFATHLSDLLTLKNASSIDWPLAHGTGYRDDFFSLLEQPIK